MPGLPRAGRSAADHARGGPPCPGGGLADLPDVNVLVSLAWPNHVHHGQTLRWFRSRPDPAWATTPVTEIGFVRVSANPAAVGDAVTPAEAIALLARMREVPGHRFLVDDVELVVGETDQLRLATHRQVTDGHLIAVARRYGARLVTHDRGLIELAAGHDVFLVPLG